MTSALSAEQTEAAADSKASVISTVIADPLPIHIHRLVIRLRSSPISGFSLKASCIGRRVLSHHRRAN